MTKPSAGLRLVLWSVAGVFSQLALVRMSTTLASGVSYYGNALLLVGIVAVSAGLAAPHLAKRSPLVPAALLLPVWLLAYLSTRHLVAEMGAEFLWSTVSGVKPAEVDFDLQLAILLIAFSMTPALLFMGAAEGRAFLAHGDEGLRPYLLAAAGGVGGAALFLATNELFPALVVLLVVWAGVVAAPLLLEARSLVGRLLPSALLVAFVSEGSLLSAGHHWSPYQRIDVVPFEDGEQQLLVLSNGLFIMCITRVPAEEIRPSERPLGSFVFGGWLDEDERVLVLGSGAGTDDVGQALTHGAGKVTAVEIDEAFVELGLRYDPRRAYADPRTEVIIDDARAFLANSIDRYDVVFAPYLDSQTNASNQARFRLDSFLYTKEGLSLALARVDDGGMLVNAFVTATPWMARRLYDTLAAAAAPLAVRVFQDAGGLHTVFVVTKGPRELSPLGGGFVERTASFAALPAGLINTDDWPFLYSEERVVPFAHVRLLVTLLLFMLLLVLVARPFASGGPVPLVPRTAGLGPLLVYACASGAGFFFIELRTISALAPVLGSTYKSQALIIIAVLSSSVVGALLAGLRRRLAMPAAFGLLFLALFVAALAPDVLHPYRGAFPSTPLFVVALLLPTLVAGYLYVLFVRGQTSGVVVRMQRWNLLGGALGGLSEALVVVTGFERSIAFAAGFYVVGLVAAGGVALAGMRRRS